MRGGLARRPGRLWRVPAAAATVEVGRPDEGARADEAGDGEDAAEEEEEARDAAATTGDATRRWRQRRLR